MSKKKYVKKHDFSRIILTELFPYEVPIVFNVEGWRNFCFERKEIFIKKDNYFIPFNYEIKKGDNEFRTLTLIHPLQCDDFIDFYKKYGTYIIYLCNKQIKISLRFPTRITNSYYSDDAIHYSKETIEIDEPGNELIEYVKFFTYRRFDGLYKFYESADYQRLEKKYMYCFITDISKCFYSIYTHTISWAVKNQEIAKANKNDNSFDSAFDKLMQKANYNETHGIIVGPEISRIFAEIILQKIDGNIVEKLQNEKYVLDRDYTIRRYVDDYYIYYNDKTIFSHIYRILQKCLLEYKLSINESKSEYLKNPFISNNTIAKSLLSEIISENLNIEKISNLKFYHGQKVITQIKAIVNTYSIKYSSIVSYLLGALDDKISKYLKSDILSKPLNSFYENIETLFSIYFFFYNMDIRVDTSYKLAKRILETLSELSNNEGIIDNLVQFFVKELEQCFDKIKNIGTIKNVTIESINYIYTLLAIQSFCKKRDKIISFDYYFDKLFFNNIEKRNLSKEYFSSFNYFEIIVFIHSYREQNIKMEILKNFLKDYFHDKKIEQDAESFYLFIDIQTCPYTCFDINFKEDIFSIVSKNGFVDDYRNDFVKFNNELINGKYSFTEWEINLDNVLNRLLTKKERLHYDK